MRFIAVALGFFLLSACAEQNISSSEPTLAPITFSHLEGWENNDALGALQSFLRSCKVLAQQSAGLSPSTFGKGVIWNGVCHDAEQVAVTNDDARLYFEKEFQPYKVLGPENATGLFTGYYAPELKGSLEPTSVYQTPLYPRPTDLVDVDLGVFDGAYRGKHLHGKVAGHMLVPYDTRAAIAEGSLEGRCQPLVWVDDPIDAFFLEIQGSGNVRLKDGTKISLGYDDTNGHTYKAIGRVLLEREALSKPVTMSSIRAWLVNHPSEMQDILNINESYVFFRLLPEGEPIGAQGVALTAERSLAVDPAFVPLGAPLWLDTTDGSGFPIRRLMVAQDTGGAIKGAVRGDIFWGSGERAAEEAGSMQSRGSYYLLLPKI